MDDVVTGGWYDAGDYLKLTFPLCQTVGLLSWGLTEFRDAYMSAGEWRNALNNLRIATDYMWRSMDWNQMKFLAQIGDPNIDHNYWGRPEQQTGSRPAYWYDRTMAANDLYGGVAGALASASMVFLEDGDPAFANQLLTLATTLFGWGLDQNGKYSNYYTKVTKSIYPSTDYGDNMAWAAGWLYRATGDVTYLNHAIDYWKKQTPDIYPGWDSVWAHHAIHMTNLASQGTPIPGIEVYNAYMDKFLRAWLVADGTGNIGRTPMGLIYPMWNQWANEAFSTTSAALILISGKYTQDPTLRAQKIQFAQSQVDYALGSGVRSYVVGYGYNAPSHEHHAASSCPNMPAPCGQAQFNSKDPNPQILYGALVGGPAGQKKDKINPDYTYSDKRSDYVTNEVALDYNAGLTTALAGLYDIL